MEPPTSPKKAPDDRPDYQRDDIARSWWQVMVASFQRWEDRLGQGMVSMIMMLIIFAAMMIYAFAVKPI